MGCAVIRSCKQERILIGWLVLINVCVQYKNVCFLHAFCAVIGHTAILLKNNFRDKVEELLFTSTLQQQTRREFFFFFFSSVRVLRIVF